EIECDIGLGHDARCDGEDQLALIHRLRICERLSFSQADAADMTYFQVFSAEVFRDVLDLFLGRIGGDFECIDKRKLLRPCVIELIDCHGYAYAEIAFTKELSVDGKRQSNRE